MDKSPFLGLSLTPVSEGNKKFIVFRTEIAGDDDGSNMMLIDTAISNLSKRQGMMESAKFTWGTLKDGYAKNHDTE